MRRALVDRRDFSSSSSRGEVWATKVSNLVKSTSSWNSEMKNRPVAASTKAMPNAGLSSTTDSLIDAQYVAMSSWSMLPSTSVPAVRIPVNSLRMILSAFALLSRSRISLPSADSI